MTSLVGPKGEPMAPSYEDLTDEQKAALAAAGVAAGDTPQQQPLKQIITGFVAFLEMDGVWRVHHDLSLAAQVAPLRPAGPDDMYAAAAMVQKDVVVQLTAIHTQQMMMQAAQAIQQQQENARIAATLNSGLRV